MKSNSHFAVRATLMLGSAGLLLAARPLLAEDAGSTGFYIGADGGVNLANLSGEGVSIPLDTGYRVDFTTGYGLKLSDKWILAPEMEVGFLYNSQSSLLDYYQIPVLAKAVLTCKFNDAWSIYGGGGAGYELLDQSELGLDNTVEDLAWQVEAGLKYSFGRSDLGLGYKHLEFAGSGLNVSNDSIMLSYTLHF